MPLTCSTSIFSVLQIKTFIACFPAYVVEMHMQSSCFLAILVVPGSTEQSSSQQHKACSFGGLAACSSPNVGFSPEATFAPKRDLFKLLVVCGICWWCPVWPEAWIKEVCLWDKHSASFGKGCVAYTLCMESQTCLWIWHFRMILGTWNVGFVIYLPPDCFISASVATTTQKNRYSWEQCCCLEVCVIIIGMFIFTLVPKLKVADFKFY